MGLGFVVDGNWELRRDLSRRVIGLGLYLGKEVLVVVGSGGGKD